MEDDKFKAMTDEQLVRIVNNRLMLSGEEGPAAVELYRRQKQQEGKNLRVQKWILRLTVTILVLTAIGLVIAVLSYMTLGYRTPLKVEGLVFIGGGLQFLLGLAAGVERL